MSHLRLNLVKLLIVVNRVASFILRFLRLVDLVDLVHELSTMFHLLQGILTVVVDLSSRKRVRIE